MEYVAKTSNNATVKQTNSLLDQIEPWTSVFRISMEGPDYGTTEYSDFCLSQKKKRHLIFVRAEQLFWKKTFFCKSKPLAAQEEKQLPEVSVHTTIYS